MKDAKRIINELREQCGIDAERIGALIGLSGSQVRQLATGRRHRLDYEPGCRLVALHAEVMARAQATAKPAGKASR